MIDKETAIELAKEAGHEYDGEGFAKFVHHLCNLAIAHAQKDAWPVAYAHADLLVSETWKTQGWPMIAQIASLKCVTDKYTLPLYTHPSHDDTALLRQALEALEAAMTDDKPYICKCVESITALRERFGEKV